MTLLFITGNKDKLREVQTLIPDVQGLDLDLPEIQEIDPHKVIAAKLVEARKHHSGVFLVEDTSLSLDGMGGLPGPFIRWFITSIGVGGVYALTRTFGARATARTIFGYADENDNMLFFEGSLGGLVVPPRGTDGFGWDSVFQPDHFSKTFAEMSPAEKNLCSMRKKAVAGLQRYLETQHASVPNT
ncbi:non-canonical purine NTP pyrophosphatase [Ktedonobacter sp. SOSP1-85]|uniref:non-canonical purine NTP pyrophosphatase n=1 Tax=Ktedonobacter sp. SOSP1-85 TaxID=2778367 RepID=UPI00191566B3|nr:non-canonical purine NTP pyrophosphatase [Ktedonobacter sp. SOSP1-85]GHO77210.1 non-canonical purine NTP pyrophosphatase [Ktedonobacter sp. SOSP1-85]